MSLQFAGIPWVESADFPSQLAKRILSSRARRIAESYHRDGFVVIEDINLVEDIDCDAIWLGLANDISEGRLPGTLDRVQDAWRNVPAIRAIAKHPAVLEILRLLYGREPQPFQTLNFLNGTEQRAHSDTIHFSAMPARFMCGVWVALEDITVRQGPLLYYVGSHKLPEFDYEDLGIAPIPASASWTHPALHERYVQYEDKISNIAIEAGFQREELSIKKGSFLIWSSNLLHGGAPRADPVRTRRSQVTHYYFDDTIRYTPMRSEKSRDLYYARFTDSLRSGLPMPDKVGEDIVVWLPNDHRRSIRVLDPSDIELADRYLERYPDVQASVYGTSRELAIAHYNRYGVDEGRHLLED